MKILALDTASIVASAAVIDEEKLICETIINYKKTHSEKLMVTLDHMLKDTGLTIDGMDAFAIAAGPGSFTGLRIGMATVKGFAQALNKPVVSVSTLEALAYNLLYTKGIVCPLLDAQRNQTYAALYRTDGKGNIDEVATAKAWEIGELINSMGNYSKETIYILGDGVFRFKTQITQSIDDVVVTQGYLGMNRASSVGQLALKKVKVGDTHTYRTSTLSYLRPSYAEEKKR